MLKYNLQTQEKKKKHILSGICVVLMKPFVSDPTINNKVNTITKPVMRWALPSLASSSSSSAFKFPHSWGCISFWTTPDSSCAADVVAVLDWGRMGRCKTSDSKDEVHGQKSLPAQRSLECAILTAYLWSSTVEQKGSVMVCKHFLLSQILFEVSDKNVQKPAILL